MRRFHLARLARWIVPALTLVSAFVAGLAAGVELALIVLAAGALALVIALIWGSVQSLTGESPMTLEEAFTVAQPTPEEEQKLAVMRALRDLSYERSVGKISEDDYQSLSARYRAEAKHLMARIDEELGPRRARVERRVERRLSGSADATQASGGKASPASADEPATGKSSAVKAKLKKKAATAGASITATSRKMTAPASVPCGTCGTRNDLDAHFCKSCGHSLGGQSA
ncbi:MAG TPA: zinc ribbon domain-containing protein [Polyangiaceae bacterium]|jgi:hypothetical protein